MFPEKLLKGEKRIVSETHCCVFKVYTLSSNRRSVDAIKLLKQFQKFVSIYSAKAMMIIV